MVLAIPGCGSMLNFTPERAAVEALLGPPELTGRPENIVPGSVKVAQTQDWQDSSMVVVTFNATETEIGVEDCLYLFQVTRIHSEWAANHVGGGCWTAVFRGELFQQSLQQSWGSDEPGKSWVFGLVYDDRIVSLDILWEDGERAPVAVVNGTYFWPREGVHETVMVRSLDENGDLVE
jgi:hypothetical protein